MGALRKFRRVAAAIKDCLTINEASGGGNRRTVHFETLENRVLLSGDTIIPPQGIPVADIVAPLVDTINGVPYIEPAAAAASAATSITPPPNIVISNSTAIQSTAVEQIIPQQQTGLQLVFVDPAVSDYSSIIKQINPTKASESQIEIKLLDSNRDGIDQITEALSGRKDVSAVHIISHGATGFMQIGDSYVDQQELEQKTNQLASWKDSIKQGGDILLYGCDIADGETGIDFVRRLGEITGLDVAASTNATGSAILGADWVLEYSTGVIEASPLFVSSNYAYELADVPVSGTGGDDIITVNMAGLTIAGGTTTPTFFNGDLLTINGMTGTDTFVLTGTSGDDTFTLDGLLHRITINSTTIVDYSDFEKIIIDGGLGNDQITVTNGISFSEGVSLASETINIDADITTGTGAITLTAAAVDNGILSNAQAHININNAVLNGAAIILTASSSVTATAAGLLNLPGAEVALITVDSNADITISGSSQLVSTGDVTLTASSIVDTTATALANSSNTDTEIDAAVATSIVDSAAVVHIGGTTTLSVGGALVMGATNTRTVTTIADGTAGGAGGSVAVAVVSGDTQAFLDESASILSAGSISLKASKLDNITTKAKAATGGATNDGAAAPSTAENRLSEYNAETSEGSVTFAAAVAVTDIHGSCTSAYIASNQSITTAGLLTIGSFDNSDASALADGTAVGSASAGTGAAVAINLADIGNEAYIGGTGVVSAKSLAIEAGLTPEAGESPLLQSFSAEAISGASATKTAVAGSLAINIVDAESVAVIKSGANVVITGSGDVTLRAENNTSSKSEAKPEGEGATAGSVGIGASVALNIANNITVAQLEDTAVLTGVDDLTLSATSDNSTATIAKAGGAATGGSGVGIGGAIAISVANNETRADLGSGGLQTITGDLSAKAVHTGSTTTVADGKAGGASAGIGIALGLNIANDNTYATTERNISALGDITFAAYASAASSAGAKASSAGAKEEEGSTPDKKGVDKKIASERGLADKKAAETGTKGTGDAEATPEAETSGGGVSVAAAVGVNLAASSAKAYIPDSGIITSGGLLTVSTSNNTDATAKADGTATGAGTANIGAAVAINLVSAQNQATIGSGATINAEWLTVEAKRTEVKGDTTGVIGAEAVSGASGGKVGIAGSLAINISDSKNEALIKSGANVALAGGDVKLTAEGSTSSTVLATAKGAAVAPEEKVTAAGDTAPVTKDTLIGTAEGQVKVETAGAGKDDLKITLRDGSIVNVNLNGVTKVQDVIDKINTAGGSKLEASFDETKQQIQFTDKTTFSVVSEATSVTQSGSPVFYRREGGTAVAVPLNDDSEALNFALQVGSNSPRFFVTVASKEYLGDSNACKKAWLADIKEAVRQAMVDAGQLEAADAAVVDVKFIGGRLIFDSAKTMTIWTDTTAGAAGAFKIEALNASKAISQLGLDKTTANTEGTVVTGSKLTTVAPADAADANNGGALGIGASVALNIANTTALAELSNTAVITGADSLTISADTVTSATTTATAGGEAAGGSGVGIGGAIAITVSNTDTKADIGSGNKLTLTGDLDVSATHSGKTVTKADGSASGGAAAVGIALGLNIVNDSTLAVTSREIEATGDISFKAHAAASTEASAKASAAGAEEEKANPDEKGVDKKIGAERGLADKKAAETGTKGTEDAEATPEAETSGGGVSVAAAVGVNIAGSSAQAYIPDSGKITAGGTLTLSSSNNTDASAKADGSATGSSSVGIGAAVAINVPILKNEAYIGHNADIHAGGLVIEAVMTDVKGDKKQNFGAEATSGASGKSVGIAGSLAFSILDSESLAVIKSGAQVTLAGGDARLTAENTTVNTVIAKPEGEGAVAGSVGIGASVALNLANTVTVAEVEDTAVLTGAHDLTLSATSDNSVITTAKAGGAATGGSGVGIGGAIATSLANNDTRADLGSGGLQTVTGNLSAVATHTGSTSTFADGSAGGASAGIGIALGLNIVNDSTLATTERNIVAAGDVTFAAHAAAASSAGAKASAAGAKDEGDTPDEQGVDKKIGSERGLADKKATETGTKGTGTTETPKAETSSGGVSVAAAVGVNLASSTALAYIPAGGEITSGGLLTVSTSNNSDATAKANGMATGAGAANVGAAVAINLVSAQNLATIGANAKINAKWLTVEAKRTEVKGDTTGVIGAEAISGASGGKVGIAGSLAINISDSKNEAIIGSGATVTLTGGDVTLTAEGATASTVLATAKGSAVAPDEKVVAAGDTALITPDTKIGTAAGELDITAAGVGKNDLKFTLRNGNVLVVSLNGATTVKDVIDKINSATGNGGKLIASFDEAKQQIQFTDKTTSFSPPVSSATSVTQTGTPVFYRRDGGTPVAVPLTDPSETLNFALRVGTLNERIFVTVASKTYSGDSTANKTAWLADIKEAIRQAMVDAGQLKDGDAAVVNVKFIGGQLVFDSAKTLTIWTDTTAGTASKFKIEAQNASTAISQLGLDKLTANTDGTVLTGAKLTTVAPAAAPAATGAADGSLGIGASLALNIANTTALAEVVDTAVITGANNLTLAATSISSSTVTSTAGGAAAGGSGVGIGGAISIAVLNTDTKADIGSGTGLTLTGDFSATATHTGTTATKADAAASGGAAAVGIALGLNVVNDSTLSTTNRTITAAGDVTFAAHASAATSSEATASAAGAEEEKSGTPDNGVDQQIGNQKGLADKKATETGTKGTGTTETPKAETSGGGVSVAAAVGVNLASSTARAYIPDSGTITAGGTLTLSSSNNSDATAKADGSATGSSSVGIGAAVAINVPILKNEAYIGNGATVHAGGLVVEALMTDVDGDKTQNFGAEATSGASGKSVGIAGSLAFSILDSESSAVIRSGANVTITGGGDVRLTAENTTVNSVIAKPEGEGAVAGSVGIGASVALNIANTVTAAEIEDTAILTGAHDLTLSATSDNSVITEAKAGGAATGGSGVGIGGAIATSVANNDTRAVLGSGALQTVSGNLNATATHTGSTTTFADGAAGGSSAAIGIALGLNIVNDSTLATTKRNINATGDITFAAHAAAASSAGAKASAAGAKDEGDTPDDKGVDKKIGAERSQADKKAGETGTKGTGDAKDTPAAETSSGGVSVAAAVGVNIASSTALAYIPDNGIITSGGLLTVSASNNSDGTAKADGTATGAGAANVGAAVAINLISAQNQAYVGENSTISAKWLTVEAKRTEIKGDTTGVVGAEAISGASGGKVGIAGSLALNISDSKNEALIKSGAQVTLTGGDVKLIAEGSTASTVIASAKGSAVDLAPAEKVVAAGDTALITLDTKIGTAPGELNLTFAGAGVGDLVINLRNDKSFVVVLNGAVTVRDVITKINSAGNNKGQLIASFDEAKQQIVLTDTTTVATAISASTSVTQTGSPVFYRRNGGTAVAVPFQETNSEELNFALRIGTLSERIFVTVASKDYDNGNTFDQTKAAWLADIKEAIRLSMIDAGQLKATDAAVVNVKFIGGQLIFDSAKTLTIWTDTKAGSAKQFKAEAVGSATALSQLGLTTTTTNTEGTVLTGAKLTAVAPAAATPAENLIGGLTDGTTYYIIADGTKVKLATSAANATAGTAIDLTSKGVGSVQNLGAKSFASTAVDITANTIDLGAGHGLTTGTAVIYKAGSEGSTSGSLGIGASLALNIANITALAEVADNALLIGANNLTLSADSITSAHTYSTAGGEAGGGKGVGIGGAISLTVANNDTRADIGSGSPLTIGGNFSATATHNGTTATMADAAASGGAAAVGIALGLNVALDDTLATTNRQIIAGGDVTFAASTISKSSSDAKASAAGAKGEEPAAGDGSGGTPKNGVDQQVGDQRGLADKKANAAGTKNTGTTETKKAETSDGGVSVAGAVGVNIAITGAKAFIPDYGEISAGGTVTLRTSQNTDASARGDGSAVDPLNSVGVGVGIGINFAMVNNSASIGSGAVVNAAGVVVEAGMAEVAKPFALTSVYENRDSIDLGKDNGLRTGDAVVYDNGGGSSISGLTNGQTYYVVADNTRTFNARPNRVDDLVGSELPSIIPTDLFEPLGDVSYKDNWIDLGSNHLLKDGDLVVYSKGNILNLSAIGGLTDGATYIVDVDEANPTRIKLLDAKTKAVVDLTFVTDPQKFNYLFDHKFTIVEPTAVKLALTAEAAFRGETIDISNTGASGYSTASAGCQPSFRCGRICRGKRRERRCCRRPGPESGLEHHRGGDQRRSHGHGWKR